MPTSAAPATKGKASAGKVAAYANATDIATAACPDGNENLSGSVTRFAFAESASPNWQETMEMRALRSRGAGGSLLPIEVEVRLQDVLDQGGLIYPVESVTVERAWYCTLPSNGIAVRRAG